jgi:hypothetical protein
MHREEIATFYLTMADHLAATHPEIVDDSHPGMIACEGRREFYLIAKVLPRFRHRMSLNTYWLLKKPRNEAPVDNVFASGKISW